MWGQGVSVPSAKSVCGCLVTPVPLPWIPSITFQKCFGWPHLHFKNFVQNGFFFFALPLGGKREERKPLFNFFKVQVYSNVLDYLLYFLYFSHHMRIEVAKSFTSLYSHSKSTDSFEFWALNYLTADTNWLILKSLD